MPGYGSGYHAIFLRLSLWVLAACCFVAGAVLLPHGASGFASCKQECGRLRAELIAGAVLAFVALTLTIGLLATKNSQEYQPSALKVLPHLGELGAAPRVVVTPPRRQSSAVNVDQLRRLREELFTYINSRGCNPIVVRLGWHDAGTYDHSVKEWPKCGGANGSIRFEPEINHGANRGLPIALAILNPLKDKYPDVSYADLYQMASAVGIEAAGGPKIPMRYGRKDVHGPEECAREGNLPAGGHPFPDGSSGAADHLRRVFYRMGLTDQDIVALSGAHTLGRARPDRSGFGRENTKYTCVGPGLSCANSFRTDRPTTAQPAGQTGMSWTVNWLEFDNSYFQQVKAQRDADLLVLETDACLFEDDAFRPYAELYAADQASFFSDYAASHAKLSELGVKWEQGGPVTI